MDAMDRRVRTFIFDRFLETGAAPALAEVVAYLGCPVDAGRQSLRRLDDAHHLKLLDGTDRILMAFPFSAIATPYRVTRPNGRRYFANCAWDSIAFHAMLDEPVQIGSFCAECASPIAFRMEHGTGVADAGRLPSVWLKLPAADWWKDIVRTCANTMVFLCSADHGLDDLDDSGRAERGVVTVDLVHRMGLPLYQGKLRDDYDRPPVAEIRAWYERLGLRGPHWAL